MIVRPAYLLVSTLILSAGCSDSTADSSDGVGGTTSGTTTSHTTTSSSGSTSASTTGSSTSGSTSSGGGLPDCSAQGLTPPAGPFACGPVGCAAGSVCVESTVNPGPDACLAHFCASLPADCTADPTCSCVAGSLDYANTTPPTCVAKTGGLWLVGDDVANPPWNPPACPAGVCEGGEQCWGCFVDGPHGYWEAPDYQCNENDPSTPAIQFCAQRPAL